MNSIGIVKHEIHERSVHIRKLVNNCIISCQLEQMPEYMIQLKRQILFIIEKYKKETSLLERSTYMKASTLELESFVRSFWDTYVKRVKQLK